MSVQTWPEFKSEFVDRLEALSKSGVGFDDETLEKIRKLTDEFVYKIEGIQLERDKKMSEIRKNQEIENIKKSLSDLTKTNA